MLDINKALLYWNEINNSKNKKLINDLKLAAIRYSRLRVDNIISIQKGEKITNDHERTVAHNVFIDSCNILSRNMIKNNENANWRKELGNDRKTIGDFACLLRCTPFIGQISQ